MPATDLTLRLALFGDPVAHSRSPHIHAAFGRQAGLDLTYETVTTTPESLARHLRAWHAQGGHGTNLTVPVKQAALSHCEALAPRARLAGAVNTLVRTDGGWRGDNTDGGGLLLDLRRLNLDPCRRRVLVLGAGGAVAGILGALLDAGAAGITLLNRSPERALALAARFSDPERLHAGTPDQPCDLIIQATSLGHSGQAPPLAREWLAPGASAYDLNYGSAHDPFLDLCRSLALPCHDGLGMLVGQAALSFELWTGIRPEVEPLLDFRGREI